VIRFDVVIATYNGEQYIQEQIQSIQQNYGYSEMVARMIVVDDGSTDTTLSIVKALAEHDDKIEWHENQGQSRGAAQNFAYGLSLTGENWVALSDQDDVWLPEKLTRFAKRCNALQHAQAAQSPMALFSDKLIVDAHLTVTHNSYFALKRIPYNWHESIEQLAMQNVASGCAMVVNRPLLTLALPLPSNAYMHDWWLVLVAKQFGEVHFINAPLIKYRQHSNNTIGATQSSTLQELQNLSLYWAKFKASFEQTSKQAQALCELANTQEVAVAPRIKLLAEFYQLTTIERLVAVMRKRITRSSLKARLALMALAIAR
jgi:glycosyltransferase involved in cell wall biosynthesis